MIAKWDKSLFRKAGRIPPHPTEAAGAGPSPNTVGAGLRQATRAERIREEHCILSAGTEP
jgi:hypothetical protein